MESEAKRCVQHMHYKQQLQNHSAKIVTDNSVQQTNDEVKDRAAKPNRHMNQARAEMKPMSEQKEKKIAVFMHQDV